MTTKDASANQTEFDKNGVLVIPDFIHKADVTNLNAELDKLFTTSAVNGRMGFIQANPNLREISFPTIAVRNVNLLELALKVKKAFQTNTQEYDIESYILTNIEIFEEKDNPIFLFWHTDNRKSMFRAQIYLVGGEEDSGAFRFMNGTHKRNYDIPHKCTKEMVERYRPEIRDCIAPPGSLILFDGYGFHAKRHCIKRRRTIMFEFQPRDSKFDKCSIFFSSSQISKEVLKNMDSFLSVPPKFADHGIEKFFIETPPLAVRSALKEAWRSLSTWTKSLKSISIMKARNMFSGIFPSNQDGF